MMRAQNPTMPNPEDHELLPPAPRPRRLQKAESWSPDMLREDVWRRRKDNESRRRKMGGTRSLTDDDMDELKGCIELGFGFGPDSPELDPKLSGALPALGFYCSVNKQYSASLSRSCSLPSNMSEADVGGGSTVASPIFDPEDDPEMVKTRLRHWAQVVACSAKQLSGVPY